MIESEQILVNKGQLGRIIGVCPRQIEIWVKQGRIPALKLGRRCVRFEQERVLAALRRFEIKEVGRPQEGI